MPAIDDPVLIVGLEFGFILLDYDSFVVHVFTERTRAFYDLGRLWLERSGPEGTVFRLWIPESPPANEAPVPQDRLPETAGLSR